MEIIVVDLQGVEHRVEGVEGWRVMEIIREHGLPIKAECGGACACATCHVYVDAAWVERIAPKRDEEEDMLDEAMDVRENSRLSCQIIMSEELNGLKVFLANDPDDL